MTGHAAADGASRNGYQASYQRLRGMLRDAVQEAVEAGPAARDRAGSMEWRMGAALGALLAAHPVDRRGRCRLCRGRGWLGRRRVCMVFQKTHYWLRQLPDSLPGQLATEWGIDLPPSRYGAQPQTTPALSGRW